MGVLGNQKDEKCHKRGTLLIKRYMNIKKNNQPSDCPTHLGGCLCGCEMRVINSAKMQICAYIPGHVLTSQQEKKNKNDT